MAEALRVRGLRKSYPSVAGDVEVLKGLDLSVSAGEFVAVLGPSGSGKSTLLNILGLMDSPTSGEVLLDGRPISDLPETERALLRGEKLGFVFQFDALLPEFTILENVTMPARVRLSRRANGAVSMDEAFRRAAGLLDSLGLGALPERFPPQVSGGERQRAALARALINRPGLILADEPTGNLDKKNGERVFRDLKALAEREGAAVVMVTHNEAAIGFATRSTRLSDGVLREAGWTAPNQT